MTRTPGRLSLLFIFITVMTNMIGFGIIMPVMPQLIMEVTGEDLAHAARWGGNLTVAYAVMQFIMSPVIGGLSDRFGRRPVLLGSLAGYSLDFLIMALAPTIWVILVGRLMAGAFAATFATANAFVADISAPEKRAANFGVMGAAFGLGFIIGPALGGLIGDAFGPRAPFFAASLLGACNFLFGLIILPETLTKENRRPFQWRRANAFGNFRQLVQYPVLVPIALAVFAFQIAHWTFPSTWSYYAEARFAWSPSDIGWSLMAVGLAAAVVQGGLTRLIVPRLGEARTAVLGVTIMTASLVGYAFADKAWMIYLLIPLSAMGGLTQPALQGIMSRSMPSNAQGELQGMIAALSSITMIISPLMMTRVFAYFSEPGAPVQFPGAAFLLAAMITLIAFIPLTAALGRLRASAGETAAE